MKSNMAFKMAAKIKKNQNSSIMTLPELNFFSGSMRPALWVFILKMNTLLDIKIKRQLVGELSILKSTWGGKMRESLLSYCNFVNYET